MRSPPSTASGPRVGARTRTGVWSSGPHNVSRETLADSEPSSWRPPLDARAIEVLEQAYADAARLGFLGPKELDRLWARHLDDAFGLAAIRQPKPGERWADLGSGAGLPGLPLAIAHPATSFTLVDAQRRRLDWVAATAAQLRLANVAVVHARLEEYGHGPARQSFDVATARRLGRFRWLPSWDFPCSGPAGDCWCPEGSRVPRNSGRPRGPVRNSGGGSTKLSPTRRHRLTGSGSSLSWLRSLRPPPASPGDRVCRRVLRSASCATTSVSAPRRRERRQGGVVGCSGIEETSRGGTWSLIGTVRAFGISWPERRLDDETARAGPGGGSRALASGVFGTAPGLHAPPGGCYEGRREPSVGDPMKHRRSKNERAVS